MSKFYTEQEYVDEHRYLFRRLHQHDGVWWNQLFPGYAKPAFRFRALVPGSARPARLRSLLGYSHHVPELAMGNQVMDYMILEGENLRRFGLDRLDPNTRNHVRKGFKRCEVKEIAELEPYLEDTRQVCISQSERLVRHRQPFHVPHTYFIEQADSWRTQMRRDFASRGRRWWGAFSDKRLVGYIVTLQVESVMTFEKIKVHADALPLHVTDVLYFMVLENAAHDETCLRIFNSTPQREGLDRFKKHYLFRPTSVPFYVSSLSLFKLAMQMLKVRDRLVLRLRASRRYGLGPAADGRADTYAHGAGPGSEETALNPKTSEPVTKARS
jgi:hypothetical protein